MLNQQQDKRKAERIDVRAEMRYQIRGGLSSFVNAVVDNLSASGMAFNNDTFIAPSTPIMLEINLLSRVLHPVGRVAWCQPLPHSYRNRLGVEFLEMDGVEKRHLLDYINMHKDNL